MSHGGAPTEAWVDAVNAAYERGTALFAAEGDFFSAMPDPLPPNGIIIPASPMYPAAFRRVLGVTAIGKTLEVALSRCYRAVGDIDWEGMQYRRDIGRGTAIGMITA